MRFGESSVEVRDVAAFDLRAHLAALSGCRLPRGAQSLSMPCLEAFQREGCVQILAGVGAAHNDVAADERPSTQRQRRDDAVDVLSEALWELWLRRHAQAQRQATAWDEEERAHG